LKQPRIHIGWYAAGDFIAAIAAWVIFYFIRKHIIEEAFLIGPKFYTGLLLYPFAWIILYHLTGSYKNIYNKSRLVEFLKTFSNSFAGSIVILYCMTLPVITTFITKNFFRC